MHQSAVYGIQDLCYTNKRMVLPRQLDYKYPLFAPPPHFLKYFSNRKHFSHIISSISTETYISQNLVKNNLWWHSPTATCQICHLVIWSKINCNMESYFCRRNAINITTKNIWEVDNHLTSQNIDLTSGYHYKTNWPNIWQDDFTWTTIMLTC